MNQNIVREWAKDPNTKKGNSKIFHIILCEMGDLKAWFADLPNELNIKMVYCYTRVDIFTICYVKR